LFIHAEKIQAAGVLEKVGIEMTEIAYKNTRPVPELQSITFRAVGETPEYAKYAFTIPNRLTDTLHKSRYPVIGGCPSFDEGSITISSVR